MSDELMPSRLADPAKQEGKTTVSNEETNKELAPVSPTGTPVLSPTVALVLTIVVAVLGVIPSILTSAGIALPAWVAVVGGIITAIASALGIASPGIRKKE